MRNRLLFLVCCFAGIVFASCTPQRVREAQVVVSQADSLKAVGAEYDDSLRLAEAAWILASFPYRIVDVDDYTRVCYHYGRLLRRHDNQVEAMQWFIKGTNSRSKDYAIKGRMYSNMANMCRLDGDHELAYQIYMHSASLFQKAGLQTNYYYALNNMAFEKAEQGKKDEAFLLLQQICRECRDSAVLVKYMETYAIAYNKIQQYDSTIYYVNQLQKKGYCESAGIINKAQAYEALGVKDSAIYYANQLMTISHSMEDLYNALYILSYEDKNANKDDIRNLTTRRADVGMLLKKQQGNMSHAVELLENSMKHRQLLRIAISIIMLFLIIVLLFFYRVYRKNVIACEKLREEDKKLKQNTINEQMKVTELLQKQKSINELNDELFKQSTSLKEQRDNSMKTAREELDSVCLILRTSSDLKTRLALKDFNKMCSIVNSRFNMFADKLKNKNILSKQEIKFCVLVLCGLGHEQISELLNYSNNSVGKTKERIAKRLGTDSKNLRSLLINLVLERTQN